MNTAKSSIIMANPLLLAGLCLLILASCTPKPESRSAATIEVPTTEVEDTLMYVYGVAKDYMSGDTLRTYVVTAWDVNDKRRTIERPSTPAGRYDLILNAPGYYAIEYAAKGYVPKVVEIDMRVADSLRWEGGYGMNVNTTLIPALEGLDAAAMPTVIGRARFNNDSKDFEWDMNYTDKAMARQAEVLKAYEERKR